jgi:membrane protein
VPQRQGLPRRVVNRVAGTFPVRVLKRYAAASGGTWATAISWNVLFAFFPIILAITTILGFAAAGSQIGPQVDHDVAAILPGQAGAAVLDALASFHRAAGVLAIVSFVGLLWSGSSLFGAIDQGLDALYPVKQRGFVRQKVMSVGMIVVFTVLVVAATLSASLLPTLASFPGVPTQFSSGPAALIAQVIFGMIVGALLFGAIFYFVPNRQHVLGHVLPGTLVAAIMFEVFVLLFPLYFKLQHGFSTYGSTFAVFFLLMTFAFFLAQIIMLGGAVNAELHPPEPGAFPRAGSSIDPGAQAAADTMSLRELEGSAQQGRSGTATTRPARPG